MKRFLSICVYLVITAVIPGVASVSTASDTLSIASSCVPDSEIGKELSRSLEQGIPIIESEARTIQPPLTISDGGRMNLIAGHSIVLKPGTRVLAGGYFRATISELKGHKPGIHNYLKSKKQKSLEKTIEPVLLVKTQNNISPFAKKSKGRSIGTGGNNEECLNALVTDVSGISPEQNRKPIGYATTRLTFNSARIVKSGQYPFIASSEKRETTAVLRL